MKHFSSQIITTILSWFIWYHFSTKWNAPQAVGLVLTFNLTVLLVAQKSYLVVLKPVFFDQTLGIYHVQYAKDHFRWAEIKPIRGEIELNIKKNSENSKFWVLSDVWLNLTLCELNLTSCKVASHKPIQSQIDVRWDLMSHQSEIIHKSMALWGGSSGKINFMRAVHVQN